MLPIILLTLAATSARATSPTDQPSGEHHDPNNFMLNMIRVWGPELLKQLPSEEEQEERRRKRDTHFSLSDSLNELESDQPVGGSLVSPAMRILKEAPEVILPMIVRSFTNFKFWSYNATHDSKKIYNSQSLDRVITLPIIVT
jgi:hypothetical protein